MFRQIFVTVMQGTLEGFETETDKDTTYYGFRGIPYAKPPIGDLRFETPKQPESWNGIRDASWEGSECPQYNNILDSYIGEEDCLVLNVYTPKLPEDGGKDIPVMVFIHGGGFFRGSGNCEFYGPDYLMDQGVILVTVNYRLGPFGFLCLENKTVPGNAGLKDQVAALCWIKDNIKQFGGDPNNVTIFGNSAGGASVQYLLLSDMTSGLFNKAISQSGSALNYWAFQRSPLKNAIRLCSVLGFTSEDPDEIYDFLKSTTTKDILSVLKDGFIGTFVPSLENIYPGQISFLTELPIKRIQDGNFHHVPYIIGFNSAEGLLDLKDLLTGSISYHDINTDPEYMVPGDIPLGDTDEHWNKLKKYYFNDKPVSDETLENYSNLKGDTDFVYGIDKSVRLLSKLSTKPIYYYRFSFDETNAFKRKWRLTVPGACHEDEMYYLLRNTSYTDRIEKTFSVYLIILRMTTMWTNFAKTGDPTPSTTDIIKELWQPVTRDELKYLDISGTLNMMSDPDPQTMAFLDELYENV